MRTSSILYCDNWNQKVGSIDNEDYSFIPLKAESEKDNIMPIYRSNIWVVVNHIWYPTNARCQLSINIHVVTRFEESNGLWDFHNVEKIDTKSKAISHSHFQGVSQTQYSVAIFLCNLQSESQSYRTHCTISSIRESFHEDWESFL